VLAGREAQQLGTQVRQPWRTLPDVEAQHRHAASDGLRPYCLVAPADELLANSVGLPLDRAPPQERPHSRYDLSLLLGPERLRRPWLASGADFIEQLTDKTEPSTWSLIMTPSP
jgi:hypothetical protein